MATGKILPTPLGDLPSDVLSVVLFHLSPKDIFSLSTASRKVFKNVKVARRKVLQTAEEFLKGLSVTVTTFIDDLGKAIRFAHEVRSLNDESPNDEEFCRKLKTLTRSYGYKLCKGPSLSSFIAVPRVVTPSKIRTTLDWDGDIFNCIIEASVPRHQSEAANYPFSESISCKLTHLAVNDIFTNSYEAYFKLSQDASLREIVQYAKISVPLLNYINVGLWGMFYLLQ
jgi:hypothetical protein